MRKKVLIMGVIVVLIIILLVAIQLLPRPYNLTYPKYRMLEYEGKKLYFNVYKYEPPYIPQHFLKSKDEQNISTPEGTKLAVTCSAGRDREWWTSLMTEKYKQPIIKRAKEQNRKPFAEKSKGKARTFHETRSRYIYKIEFIEDGNRYAEIIEEWPISIEGEIDYMPSHNSFIKKGNIWLQDSVTYYYPSAILENHGYDELLNKSKSARLSFSRRLNRWLNYTKLKIHYLKNRR